MRSGRPAAFFILAAASAAALTGCASRGGEGPQAEPIRALLSADALLFASFDSDGDLRVATAEIEAGVTREFARADTNQDGALQPLEFGNWSNAALGGVQMPPYRLDFDRNVDNSITAEEFRGEITSRAQDYDADSDGVLTRAEFIRQVAQPRILREPAGGQARRRVDERRGQ